MQHHSMPPRPQHMRHPPMHQGPMHSGHPPPPPHMGMNMGIPPQQQPLHMPNAAARRGPPPQPYGMSHMRDQNRLGHHQHSQQHQLPRLNNQMPQNQMQHHKGRPPPHVGGGGVGPVGPLKYQNTQNSGPPSLIRNNSLQTQPTPQARLPSQQPPIPIVGNQVQIMKAPPPAQLEQQQQQQQQQQNPMQHVQHQKLNSCPPPSHLNNNQQIAHLSRPPPVPHAQQFRQQQHHVQKTIPVVNHGIPDPQLQTQQRQPQKFSHPRAILQNPNRSNHHHKIHVPLKTPLPTVSEVEIPPVGTAQQPALTKPEKLSAAAEDFTPQNLEKKSTEEDKDSENNALMCDFMSVVMKGDGCFSTSKEKTPMCLVNELARFNKIQHQYRLTSENGPAHCKRFTVTLKLGDEEYSAEGYKIKKAQHTAAAEAIKKTKYKHPLPKAIRRPEEGSLRTTITPTVELNALAMKLGQQTYYVFDPRTQSDLPNPNPNRNNSNSQYGQPATGPPHNNQRLSRKIDFVPGVHQQQQQPMQRFPGGKPKYPMPVQIPSVNGVASIPPHFAITPPPELCKITLIVGKQKFVGSGRTLQSAKHDAASRALQVLRTQAANKFKEILTRTAKEGEWKSPISLVHEIAIKHNLTVSFKVLREEGPAHMKSFITTCEVGDIVTEGDGNGKKISKKRAAEKMLEELKKLPPPSPSNSPPVKRIKVKNFKRKTSPTPKKKNSIREKTESECAEDTNPISRLIHIQQSRNEKEPTYELISRSGESKKREFVMEVNVPGKVARGTGATKKLAKRNAAQNILIAMGVEVAVENENEENNSQVANQNQDAKASRKVKFNENNNSNETLNANAAASNGNGGPSGRQIVPGVILLRQHSKDSEEVESTAEAETTPTPNAPKASTPPVQKKCSLPSSGTSVRPKDQLLYLAQILGFQANFSDYPKGNHNEFLTIVTLSTAPPQICHGVGLNIEESQDQAASAALQILSKLGLDNIKPTPADD